MERQGERVNRTKKRKERKEREGEEKGDGEWQGLYQINEI